MTYVAWLHDNSINNNLNSYFKKFKSQKITLIRKKLKSLTCTSNHVGYTNKKCLLKEKKIIIKKNRPILVSFKTFLTLPHETL